MASTGQIVSNAKARLALAGARYRPIDVLIRTLQRYRRDDVAVHAAALTYYVFFSVFPLLIFVASALGYVTFLSKQVRQDLVSSGLSAFPLLDSLLSEYALNTMQQQRGNLALVGVILGLYSGSGGVVALKRALTKIHHHEKRSGFLHGRLASLKWLAALGLTAIGSLIFGSVASFADSLVGSDSLAAEVILFLVAHIAGGAAGFVVFATAFKFLPEGRRAWREVAPGAAFAALLFEVIKVFGAWYLQRASAFQATFGAFSTAAGLLIASYLLAHVTLVAAELNAVLLEGAATPPEPP